MLCPTSRWRRPATAAPVAGCGSQPPSAKLTSATVLPEAPAPDQGRDEAGAGLDGRQGHLEGLGGARQGGAHRGVGGLLDRRVQGGLDPQASAVDLRRRVVCQQPAGDVVDEVGVGGRGGLQRVDDRRPRRERLGRLPQRQLLAHGVVVLGWSSGSPAGASP